MSLDDAAHRASRQFPVVETRTKTRVPIPQQGQSPRPSSKFSANPVPGLFRLPTPSFAAPIQRLTQQQHAAKPANPRLAQSYPAQRKLLEPPGTLRPAIHEQPLVHSRSLTSVLPSSRPALPSRAIIARSSFGKWQPSRPPKVREAQKAAPEAASSSTATGNQVGRKPAAARLIPRPRQRQCFIPKPSIGKSKRCDEDRISLDSESGGYAPSNSSRDVISPARVPLLVHAEPLRRPTTPVFASQDFRTARANELRGHSACRKRSLLDSSPGTSLDSSTPAASSKSSSPPKEEDCELIMSKKPRRPESIVEPGGTAETPLPVATNSGEGATQQQISHSAILASFASACGVQATKRSPRPMVYPSSSPSTKRLDTPSGPMADFEATPTTGFQVGIHTPPMPLISSVIRGSVPGGPQAPRRRPIARRVLISGILSQNASLVETALSDLGQDANSFLPVPRKLHRSFSQFTLETMHVTPLALAVKVSNASVVSKLLDFGAMINHADACERTALHLAFLPSPSECSAINETIAAKHFGAVIPENGVASFTEMPQMASFSPTTSRRSSLVTPRVLVSSETTKGPPLCHSICEIGSEGSLASIVQTLCIRGANLEQRDKFGRTSIAYAREWVEALSSDAFESDWRCRSMRAAALTMISFEDRIRLRLLLPLSNAIRPKGFKSYSQTTGHQLGCLPSRVSVSPGEFAPFKISRTPLELLSNTRIRTRAGFTCSPSTNMKSSRQLALGCGRSRRKGKEFDLVRLVGLARRNCGNQALLGIWEYLGADFKPPK